MTKLIKDFSLSELKPNTKYILAVDRELTVKEFNVFKNELDKWLKDTKVDHDSFLFIQNATVVELPTRPKKKKVTKK
jgi:hypothetical protein